MLYQVNFNFIINLLLLLVLILELEDDLTFCNMCFNFGVTRKTDESGWGKLTLKQVSRDVSSIKRKTRKIRSILERYTIQQV